MTGGSRRWRAYAADSTVGRVTAGSAAGRIAATLLVTIVVVGCSGTDVADAGDVYRVQVESCAGTSSQRATAMAVGPRLVASAAHTFEDARTVVLVDGDGNEHPSEIVYADFDRDVALLSLDAPDNRVFVLAPAADDSPVLIPTYAAAEGIEVKKATVVRSVNATLDGEGRRRALELAASIDRGDSGAPVVDSDGRAVGMVFASSRRADRGWAVAATELEDAVQAFDSGDAPIPTSPCRSKPPDTADTEP